tara:strand:+ start:3108 stop:4493 length:1386 start_codon:yes stop_codon:yes gene_type:complete
MFKEKKNFSIINNSIYFKKKILSFLDKIKKNSLIFLLCDNSTTNIILYKELIKKNTTLCLIDSKVDNKNLKKLINKFDPNYILLPENKKINYDNFAKFKAYNIVKTKNKILLKSNKIKILLTTSGTFSSNKFVALTKKNIIENTQSISKYLKPNKKSVFVNNLPLHYSFGFSIINLAIFKGSKLLCTDYSILNPNFWHLLRKYEVSYFSGVPYTFQILKKIKFFKFIGSKIKNICIAGGAIDIKTLEYLFENSKKNGISLFNMYGQTEASPRMSYHLIKKKDKNFLSIGKPISGGNFKIIDNQGRVVTKNNEIGEIIYSGKNVMLGYVNDRKEIDKLSGTKKFNKFLYTGDLGFFNDEHHYFITGRKKRIIKIFGVRLNLDEIEKVLNVFVTKSAIIEKDSKLYLILEEKKVNEKKIRLQLKNKFKINPNYIKFIKIKKIPLNKNNKVDYIKLKKNVRDAY